MVDKDLASLFVNCLPNTLGSFLSLQSFILVVTKLSLLFLFSTDTTVQHFSNDTKGFDTFIITGDIPAMWLRDSSAQVSPYVELAKNDPHLQDMLKGVIMRQARSILIDAYANAFLYTTGSSPHGSDRRRPPMSNKLWEGKYELDSLVWPMRLATQYWQHTSDPSICTDPTWLAAVSKAMDVIVYQQQATTSMQQSDALYYSFGRMTTDSIDTLFGGVGMPSKSVGLSRSPFRPSDDSHIFPYLVCY
jgi:meiotically up-regulated gene 157 (Mug157) protein